MDTIAWREQWLIWRGEIDHGEGEARLPGCRSRAEAMARIAGAAQHDDVTPERIVVARTPGGTPRGFSPPLVQWQDEGPSECWYFHLRGRDAPR